jgi:poly(ADP-ribose) glycohydrolase
MGAESRWIGAMDFAHIYCQPANICIQRILCQLSYFYQAESRAAQDISFERYVITSPPDWSKENKIINIQNFKIFTDSMEASPAPAFVDFANRDLHIGRIIGSMTQEEVLFSCCPELFVGLLFTERFRDDEVMIIRGVRRYCTYSGYGHTFQWTGILEKEQVHDIVVIDACTDQQFYKEFLNRDLNKAWYSFKKCGTDIVTGHWGCGAFGGDEYLKFLQQVIASTLAETNRLDYSTFKNENMKEKFELILQEIGKLNLNISQIYAIMSEFNTARKKDPKKRLSFEDWIDISFKMSQ